LIRKKKTSAIDSIKVKGVKKKIVVRVSNILPSLCCSSRIVFIMSSSNPGLVTSTSGFLGYQLYNGKFAGFLSSSGPSIFGFSRIVFANNCYLHAVSLACIDSSSTLQFTLTDTSGKTYTSLASPGIYMVGGESVVSCSVNPATATTASGNPTDALLEFQIQNTNGAISISGTKWVPSTSGGSSTSASLWIFILIGGGVVLLLVIVLIIRSRRQKEEKEKEE
jgi:hypothetical protein